MIKWEVSEIYDIPKNVQSSENVFCILHFLSLQGQSLPLSLSNYTFPSNKKIHPTKPYLLSLAENLFFIIFFNEVYVFSFTFLEVSLFGSLSVVQLCKKPEGTS